MKLFAIIQLTSECGSAADLAAFIDAANALGKVTYVSASAEDPNAPQRVTSDAGAVASAPAPAETPAKATRAKKTTESKDPAPPTTAGAASESTASSSTPSTESASAPGASASEQKTDGAAVVSIEELRATAAKVIEANAANRPAVHAIIKEFSSSKDDPKMSLIPDAERAAAKTKFLALLPKEGA